MKALEDKDIEKAVLSAMMQNELSFKEYMPQLKADDFRFEKHAEFFKAIRDINKDGTLPDLVLLSNWMKQHAVELERDDLFDISQYVSNPNNVAAHVRTLIELSQRREIIELCSQAQIDTLDSEKTNVALISELSNGINNICERCHSDVRDNKEITQSIKERIKAIQDGTLKLEGLTGLRDLDRFLLCEPGELITVAAASNVGKSWIANNIAIHTDHIGKHCLVLSMEMTAEMVAQRLLSYRTGRNVNEFREGKIDLHNPQIEDAISFLDKSKIQISDKGSFTINELESIATKYAIKGKLDVMIIDHGLLMNFGDRDSTADRISAVSRRIKALAKALKIKIVLLWQLTKEVDRRATGRPMKGDIKNTGSIYEDSDRLIMLWRPEMFGINEIDVDMQIISSKNIMVGIIEKNRHGEVGKDIPLLFYPGKGGLFNYEKPFIKSSNGSFIGEKVKDLT